MKLPHFPFYPDDWLSSQKVMIEFDDAERGIYITLLAIAWHYPDCTLPSDIEKCRLLCRAKRKIKVEKVLRTCWELTENGWRNERELTENRHAMDKHHKAVLSGKCSANNRLSSTNAERTLNERSTNQNQNQNQNQKNLKTKVKSIVEKTQKPRFVPPTVQQVKDYCLERHNKIDPQYFVDSNTAKGWVIGKTRSPAKDWKAMIRTWEKNNQEKNNGIGNYKSFHQRDIEEREKAKHGARALLGIYGRSVGISSDKNSEKTRRERESAIPGDAVEIPEVETSTD